MRVYLLALFLFTHSIHAKELVGDLSHFFQGKLPQIDLNNDGKVDLVRTYERGVLIETVYTPSWKANFREVITYPTKTQIVRERFEKELKISRTIIERDIDVPGELVEEVYSSFVEGRAQKRVVHTYEKNRKVIEYYQWDKEKWIMQKREEKELPPVIQNEYDCIQGPYVEHLTKADCDVNSNWNKFVSLFTDVSCVEDFTFYQTEMNFRIDAESCPKFILEKFDQATKELLNKKLPCLFRLNPDLGYEVVQNLDLHRNVIRCSASFYTPDGTRAVAYTYERPNADINMLRLDYKNKRFYHDDLELADILFHETLHHHLEDCPRHNRGDVRDGVYGCEFMCSDYRDGPIHEIPAGYVRIASLEGCEQCVTEDKKDMCAKNPVIELHEKCKKTNEGKTCQTQTLQAFFHPQRQYCQTVSPREKLCNEIHVLNTIGTEEFKTCSQKLVGDQKDVFQFCFSCARNDKHFCGKDAPFWEYKESCESRFGEKCSTKFLRNYFDKAFPTCLDFFQGKDLECANLNKYRRLVRYCDQRENWKNTLSRRAHLRKAKKEGLKEEDCQQINFFVPAFLDALRIKMEESNTPAPVENFLEEEF